MPPQFVIDVEPTGSRYRRGEAISSAGELAGAVRAAASYRSDYGTFAIIAAAVVALLMLMIDARLMFFPIIAGVVGWARLRDSADQQRRVAVLYRFDAVTRRAIESLRNGVQWLASSDALWRVTHEERVHRPANNTTVYRVGAQSLLMNGAPIVTNVDVPCVVSGAESLTFLPDALLVRDSHSQFMTIPYASIAVELTTIEFSESQTVPADSHRVGSAWVFANKDGSPDRQRANNWQIPVLEYARVTLTWHGGGCVLLASNVQAARHFGNALVGRSRLTEKTLAAAKAPAVVVAPVVVAEPVVVVAPAVVGAPVVVAAPVVAAAPAPPAVPQPRVEEPTDLSRALQASIDRKRREEELARQRAAAARAEADERAAAAAKVAATLQSQAAARTEAATRAIAALRAATGARISASMVTSTRAIAPSASAPPAIAAPASAAPAPSASAPPAPAPAAPSAFAPPAVASTAALAPAPPPVASLAPSPSPALSPKAAEWIPAGGSAIVRGLSIGAFVYVGKSLWRLDGQGVEPALIDPSLPIDPSHSNVSGDGVPYWPSYAGLSAASRRAFLEWLAGGRNDANAAIGYVFLFFYGLERRVYEHLRGLATTDDELLAIATEVARLRERYGRSSRSFASYSASLLELIATREPRAKGLVRVEPERTYELSSALRAALGEHALLGQPIPPELALDWVRASWSLNTPATRCAKEFERLFAIRYAAQFRGGLLLKPTKHTFDVSYRPASAALPAITMKTKIPDVTRNTRTLTKLINLAHECTGALDALSRFLGKNPHGRASLAAFALLPEELVDSTSSPAASSLAALIESHLGDDHRAHLAASELLQHVQLAKRDKVAKSEALLLAQALEKLGYGIEPDVRLGGAPYDVDGRVVVFRRLPDCPSAASDEYAAATLLMRLGAIVSGADDVVSQAERELLERHIDERLHLTPGERQRLGAHLAWLLDTKPGIAGLKKRLEGLPEPARLAIARLLIDVAGSDGHIDPREMQILEKLYDLLDLPAADLYGDVHAVRARDEEPVVVAPPVDVRGFAIPPKAARATTAAGIDMDRVRLKVAETREVSTLLAGIFVDDEQPAPAAASADAQAGTIGTLDAAHSELLRRLAQRERWPREEIEHLAAELSLLPDGALETINDYAYATANEPLWEDDDPVSIHPHVAKELIA